MIPPGEAIVRGLVGVFWCGVAVALVVGVAVGGVVAWALL